MDASCDNGTCDPLGSESPKTQQQFQLLDTLVPGFSLFSSAIQASLGIDLNLYIPLLLVVCSAAWSWSYIWYYIESAAQSYLMSSVYIRTDDEIFNMVMAWTANQSFSLSARRFIVNTNLNSRSYFLWRMYEDEEDDEGDNAGSGKKVSSLKYTPSYGTRFFWYRGRPLIFGRSENHDAHLSSSEKEELQISCFGRNPAILKQLLAEAREYHMAKDDTKTVIYRGASGSNSYDYNNSLWKRCMARSVRPFSTVILDDKVKQKLINDVSDYLDPDTRRWYSNRGIPYRRGYLLYGPPGTGKSSLSLALAGYFNMRIYILSLSSPSATEDNVSALFADLPRRCVVLLEDIDSAGLTHNRAGKQSSSSRYDSSSDKLSLSGLLNVLDGVASQEGRVLIMTTNHLEKLDNALIRPGRIDMMVEFGRANNDMAASIFRAIYTPYEDEKLPSTGRDESPLQIAEKEHTEEELELRAQEQRARSLDDVSKLAEEFAARIPENEFSPAEIQGLLLKHKCDPLAAISAVEEWIETSRKERAEKESRAEEQRRKDKKKEEKRKRKLEKKKAKKRAKRRQRKEKGEDSSSSDSESGSNSDSDSDSDSESDVSTNAGKSDTTKEKESKDEKNMEEEGSSDKKEEDRKLEEKDDEKDEEKDDGALDDRKEKATSDSGYGSP